MTDMTQNTRRKTIVIFEIFGGGGGVGSEATHLALVVGEDPGKHEVLHEVVVAAASEGVQTHQVLKVTDLTSLGTQRTQQLAYHW